MLFVRGATLAAMAASARLARLGHDVALVAEPGALAEVAESLSETVELPAAWRDLFKKSGAHLVTALNGAGLELTEAPPAVHELADGTSLELPTERGAQWRSLSAQLGEPEAARWRDLLDDLDDVWGAYRRHALEGTAPVATPAERSALWLDLTLSDLAGRLTSGLRELVQATGPSPEAPALCALPLAMRRSFGRWQVRHVDGRPAGQAALVGLLTKRLAERGVCVAAEGPEVVDIDCTGVAAPLASADDWLARTPIVGADGQLRASAASPAGAEPWAQLGSAALAVYELHERLTGEDPRPTNKGFTLPRLP